MPSKRHDADVHVSKSITTLSTLGSVSDFTFKRIIKLFCALKKKLCSEFAAGSQGPMGWRRESCRWPGSVTPGGSVTSRPGRVGLGKCKGHSGSGASTCQGLTSAPRLLCRGHSSGQGDPVHLGLSPGPRSHRHPLAPLALTVLRPQLPRRPLSPASLVSFSSTPHFVNILDVNSLRSPLLSLSPAGPRPT